MKRILPSLMLLLFLWSCSSKEVYKDQRLIAANDLIERVIPGYSEQFKLMLIDAQEGKDYFEISSEKGKITLKGNNSVAIASALNWYLKYTCNAHLSWCGDQLNLPKRLPLPKEKIEKKIDAKFRVYFNYCTLNYTASWWNWERWQREIDFMAMNGINMPLSVIGLEGVWYNTLLKFGFTDEEARKFLVGPAYFAWQWMTNIQSHGGPLPKNWIDTHIKLGQQIINRQLELGMKPIQQGFTGCVPREFIQKFPEANILQESRWCGFEGTAQLDPLDPLFEKFGKAFLAEEKKLFGAHGIYAADPFHEGHPPKETTEYMNGVGKAIYKLLSDFDPNATIAMQAWSIRKDIATMFPKGKLIVLDLGGWKWRNSENYWGYDFVVGNLHNFGGRINMHGDINLLASNQYQNAKKEAPNATGSGLFMESIKQNPAYYDMAFEMAFHQDKIEPRAWLAQYAQRRYGAKSDAAAKAWELLLDGPYRKGTNGVENSSIICARPAVNCKKSGPNAGFKIPYNQKNILEALQLLLQDADQLKASEGYRFDIVDMQRQILTNLGQSIQKKASEAFKKKDLKAFDTHSKRFLELLMDVDNLLKTRQEFSFDKWVADARKWGTTEAEKDLYEYNASLLVTQWGAHMIFDYSWREWSGLIKNYYLPRWSKFFSMLRNHIENGTEYKEKGLPQVHGREALRANKFYSNLADWETKWIESKKTIQPKTVGDELDTVIALNLKYNSLWSEYIKDQKK
ncbi:alpha-N-acetylglucosaminidase [Prolixibacteraceae bacterium JC049]|nr:alpha-N-acetylglucosaminidase [Prolixibacteraceae bacterium JC049]